MCEYWQKASQPIKPHSPTKSLLTFEFWCRGVGKQTKKHEINLVEKISVTSAAHDWKALILLGAQ
jgi:hypothetical protein